MADMPILGVLAFSLSDEFFVQIASGIHAVAREHGYHVLGIEDTPASVYAQRLAFGSVAGWIAINTAEGLENLAPPGTPAVQISCANPHPAYPSIQPDNRPSAGALAQHLIEHGHSRIAFVGMLDNPDISERVQIYQETLVANGITPDPALCVGTADYTPEAGGAAVRALLRDGLPCSAIIFGNDQHALAGMETIAALGYRIPADIAVVGFDDINAAQYAEPPLTTARQAAAEIGRAAALALIDQLAGRPPTYPDLRVPTYPVLRQSCGCVPHELQDGATTGYDPALPWPAQLAARLSRMLQPSGLRGPAITVVAWPGAAILANGLAAAIAGPGAEPEQPAILQAWAEALRLRGSADTLADMYQQLEERAQQLVREDAGASQRARRFLAIAHRLLMQAVVQSQRQEITSLTNLLWANYNLGVMLVSGHGDGAHSLQWMDRQSIQVGCIARWDAAELLIESTYARDGAPVLAQGARYAPASFPPRAMIEASAQAGSSAYVVLVPIKTEGQPWGLLAFGNDHVQNAIIGVYTTIWSVLIGGAFERTALEGRVRQERATLQSAYQRERQLMDAVRALGSPILPLLPHVLLVPLIGAIDQERVQHTLETVLNSVSRMHATHVLLDITGVAMIDLAVAEGLIQLISAARLLGAEVMLVGIRPEIAQHLTSLGSDLHFVRTYATLAAAVQRLLVQV